ncbi:uncharacterized protein PG986_012198 [Apiospora aurea]|uniref:Uncharacterized protein n=1 Tax=Apiospora aurea TaxID=335848 RepID=A0ABR1PZK1_9PEZI
MGYKVYYLAPTRHVPPDGPIALGNIVSDPRSPEIAINSSTPATTSALGKLDIHEAVELDQTRTLDNTNNVQPSVWAKFLGGLVPGLGDLGGEAGVRAASGSTSSYSFEKIVTREIFPDLEIVRSAFSDEQVQQSIKKRHWQLSVFMITGVQIAYGAEVLLNRARERGVYFQTGVDLTAATGGVAPVSVGAGLDTSSTSSQSLSTKYQSPFVFAYRLRQIMYRRKKVEKQRDDTKGNLLGLRDEDEDPRSSTDDGGVYEVQFSGLDQEDEDVPEIFDLRTEDIAAPDGGSWRIAFPQSEDADSDDE